MDRDTEVKLKVYELAARSGRVPDATAVAMETRLPTDIVRDAFHGLAMQRLLVLEPGDPSRIRMAPPFSGVETQFTVQVGETPYFANCIWDALGIPAALHRDATVRVPDGFTGEGLTLRVVAEEPEATSLVAHFAVPAAHWWDDIVFT